MGDGLDEDGFRDFDDGEDRCLDETALPAIETSRSPLQAPRRTSWRPSRPRTGWLVAAEWPGAPQARGRLT